MAAGQGKRDIARRIKAVKSTQQITKAMKMVAAAKLRRAQEKVLAARPYAVKVREVLARLAATAQAEGHPLFQVRDRKKVAYVVVTGDRGLCGSYNANVIRRAQNSMAEETAPDVVVVGVGRKGRDFFARRNRTVVREYTGLGEEASFDQAKRIAHDLIDLFVSGQVDEVRLVYTEFVSALQQKAVEVQLLPIVAPTGEQAEAAGSYIFEPDEAAVLATLVPTYIESYLFRTLLEAKASEHGARMTAMGAAADNAKKMIGKLTLAYNRARQAAITREISEIVGGAAALG